MPVCEYGNCTSLALILIGRHRFGLNGEYKNKDTSAQLSIKACPKTWLPKTLTSVQLQPIIADLCPAMVTFSPSNHSPQYKNIKLCLSLVLSKLIQKLVIALSWNN